MQSILLLATILAGSLAYVKQSVPKTECGHDSMDFNPLYAKLTDENDEDERTLQTNGTFPNMRFAVDYSTLQTNDSAYQQYISKRLLPPIIDYFSAALKVKKPSTKNIILPNYPGYRTACGVNVPNIYFTTGVSADMAVMVQAVTDSTASYVAQAGSCIMDTTTGRPYFSRVRFNLYYVPLDTDPISHETNIYTTLHELTHALGFSSYFFSTYLDANGNLRKNVVSYAQMNGRTVTIVDVEPVTTRLRNIIGCPNITGAIMEDEGGAGTVGSHFERRLFANEVMTPSVMVDMRVSELTLAMLEGSGWYVPNYNYSEPFYAGAGQGCGYYYGTCLNTAGKPNFDEYCSISDNRRCSVSGRGGAVCSNDANANGCIIPYPVDYLDCTNPDASNYAYTLPTLQSFGPNAGSRCFSGTLSNNRWNNYASNFCFTFNCQGSGLTTTLGVNIGNQTVVCSAAGPKTVAGFTGVLNCPDPLEYCQTVGKQYCPRGCMGRGSCVNNKCVCKTGFQGVDCSKAV